MGTILEVGVRRLGGAWGGLGLWRSWSGSWCGLWCAEATGWCTEATGWCTEATGWCTEATRVLPTA